MLSFLQDFDLKKILPEMGEFLGSIQFLLWVFLLICPIILVVLGVLYFFAAPKQANHAFGFRSYFTMGSVEVWQFTQRLAGFCWMCVGGLLLIVSIIVGSVVGGKDVSEMVVSTIWFVAIELAVVLAVWIGIHVVVLMAYTVEGKRKENKNMDKLVDLLMPKKQQKKCPQKVQKQGDTSGT